MIKKGLKFKIGLGAVLLVLLLTAGTAFGEAMSMLSFVDTAGGSNPEIGSITFTSYYDNDSKIHTEDSWNDENSNTGYVDSAGSCRVSPVQMGGEQTGQSYNIWVSYSGTEGNQGGTASLDVPSSGIGYTTPNPLSLSAANYLATPTGFSGLAGDGEAFIGWNQVAGATGYRAYSRPAAGEGASEIVFERVGVANSGSITGLVVSGLTNGTTYNFIMVATDSTKRSGHPDEIAVTPTAAGVPIISGPSSGVREESVTITGSNLGSSQGSVYFNGVAASSITSWSATEIIATIASGTPLGAGKLVVVTSGNLVDSIDFTVTDTSQPTITEVVRQGTNENWGYVYDTLDINGSNFGADPGNGNRDTAQNNVTIAGLTIPDVDPDDGIEVYYWSDTTISLGIPRDVSGTYIAAGDLPVVVTAGGTQSNSVNVEVRPKLYGLRPNSGPVGSNIAIDGTAFGTNTANISVDFNGTAATPSSAGNIVLDVTVPNGATTGPVTVTVNGKASDSLSFTVTAANEPRVTGINPDNGQQGQTLDVTISGADTSWDGDMASSVHFSGTGITINSASAASATSINANITIAIDATTDARTVTVDGASGSVTFTVNAAVPPSISSISPTAAEIGQTIVISGLDFGASIGDSVVRFGTTGGNPTAWGDTSITIAVPSEGITAGNVAVTVVTNGGEASQNITITGEKIYLDDFEGGAVNCFSPGPDSSYYVFENSEDITPDNDNINTLLRQAEAAYDSALGAKVRYSYLGTDGTDWGGGWGAKLANTLDLENAEKISVYIKWDGSANEATLSLKDALGVASAATISNATLMLLNDNHGEVTLNKDSFEIDEDGSDVGADTSSFDWSQITHYNFVYKTQATSADYHYIDTLTATMGRTDEAIYQILPPAGPAGTQVAIIGNGFGATQGLSDLIFENIATGAWYKANILSWSSSRIDAVVPRGANAGNYRVKIIKITIIQETGATSAWQSNDVDFMVTSSAAPEGGTAVIYPNPFNPIAEQTGQPNASAIKAVTVAFDNDAGNQVGIYIYDMTARLVYKDVTTSSQASWSGLDSYNNVVGDGAYILRVVDENSKRVIAKGKILVIKQ